MNFTDSKNSLSRFQYCVWYKTALQVN